MPYVIDTWFIINNRLEIEKGNVLKFKNEEAWVKPNGILKARGVVFTAYDTLWRGMRFDDARPDTSILDSCIIEKVVGTHQLVHLIIILRAWVIQLVIM